MRLGKIAFFASLILGAAVHAQTTTSSAFATQVLAKYTQLATVNSMTLNGTATWIAGPLRESGPATLQASTDGSSTLQLSLGKAARTETRTALGSARTCQWTDSASAVHQVAGPDCDTAISWFAPILLVEPTATLTKLLAITDDGEVTQSGTAFHQVSYRTIESGRDAASGKALTEDTRVRILYDPQTLLPASAEYVIHADNDVHVQIPVRVVYSSYQTVSGVPVPFQIDRYVNGVLQLSVTFTNTSLN